MKHRVHFINILFLLVLSLALVQPGVASADSPVQIPLESSLVAPNSALAAKLEAIQLVEAMQYPDPDSTPPGKASRKDYILLELRASSDGTFRSDNFLGDGIAFEHDINASKRLRDFLADPKVDQSVKDLATLALQKIVQADRLVTLKAIEATSVFGTELPKAGTKTIERAQQELAKGDDKVAKGMPVDAIRDYQKAWEYATQAIDLIWAAQDPDGDRVIEWIEEKLGTDPGAADTDEDGLTDGQEFTETGTDPTKADSDGNGTNDSTQDVDSDGLTNQQEVTLGTNPLRADSDREGLSDGFEANVFGSDPLKQDTDADGLTDDSEYRLGTDPRNPDSDGDGTLDGFETYTSIATSDDDLVVVELTGVGDVARTLEFQDLSEDTRFQDLSGQLSHAVDIRADAPFDNARVKLRFDPAAVPNGDFDNLRVLYYDETARTFFGLNAFGVDTENGYVWADTNHFSIFVLFYVPNWQTVWAHPMYTGRDDDDPETLFLDVMLVLDSSGSMSWNDPNGYRRIAAKRFIDALLEGDRVGVVDFDSYARLYQPLTADFPAAKAAVDRIDASGGTDIASGVRLANEELITNGDPEHVKLTILLTDGEGYYDPSLTTQAVENDIVIYTIGLGSSVDEGLLRSIAEATGGLYFPVASADQLPDVFQRIPGGGGQDTDGDGLPDLLETNGIRIGTGEIIYTNPGLWDTDGDGLSDGEELGELLEATWGNYFSSPSDPLSEDQDGDGLWDSEEQDIGTSPYRADTDGDQLSDPFEVDNEYDALDTNPDGDHRDDYDEWQKDGDPFHYDPNAEESALYAIAGFTLGEFGENWVNLGWGSITQDTIRSLPYLGGWLSSNVLPWGLGDIRDTVASLVRGDIVDTLLNALGLIPMFGDGLDAAKDTAKWLKWSDDLLLPLSRWLAKTFAESPDVLRVLLKVVGYSDEMGQLLSKQEIADLAKYSNDGNALADLVKQGVRISSHGLDGAAWARVSARLQDPELWDTAKLLADRKKLAEAKAVEAAVEELNNLRVYDILYIGRNKAITMANGTTKYLSKGPDIVAVNRVTGSTVVIEAKSAVTDVVLNGKRLQSEVGGNYLLQTSRAWLRTNAASRYLTTMQNAANPLIQEAARRLNDINNGIGSYDTIIIGYGPGAASRFGKIDEALKILKQDAEKVQMLLLDPQ